MLWFATSNPGKLREARMILARYGISIRRYPRQKVEIQGKELVHIAKFAAEEMVRHVKGPVVVEDSGLFVEALQGFPGPYSSYVMETIGLDGLLRLMRDSRNRNAYFQAVVALSLPNARTITFAGYASGRISKEAHGRRGFGFDPIFVRDGSAETFAQMGARSKNLLSHRAQAFARLGRWCQRRGLAFQKASPMQ